MNCWLSCQPVTKFNQVLTSVRSRCWPETEDFLNSSWRSLRMLLLSHEESIRKDVCHIFHLIVLRKNAQKSEIIQWFICWKWEIFGSVWLRLSRSRSVWRSFQWKFRLMNFFRISIFIRHKDSISISWVSFINKGKYELLLLHFWKTQSQNTWKSPMPPRGLLFTMKQNTSLIQKELIRMHLQQYNL